ncbi:MULTISPECIES: bifunctional aminoglycoside phosphotransferase/ATP-binding protein [unclassified Gordonia (in: high G+C Gram-positive bacteria)]
MTSARTRETQSTDLLAQTGALDPAAPTTRIDTHGATILLNGDRAWKLKRPVRLRYFDFSTSDLRHDALAAELDLNRRTAPDIYLGLHALRRADDGSASLDGPGETVDWVLEMTRFADDALLSRQADAGALDDRLLQNLAARVVDMHRDAQVSDDPHGAARLKEVVDGNLASMSAFPEILEPALAQQLTDRLTAMITAHADLMDARARAGRVRHGHGDLHLGNIAVVDGEPIPFDCLEFDAEMATTDVLYDIGFLVMDLWARGLRHEANVVINAYLDLSTDDEVGFALLPLILGVRATVRAHVAAAEGAADRANSYLSLALGFTEPVAPRLVAIGGGSGTGKSTVARAIGGDLAPAPGARILRTDVLRKRLAGVTVDEPLPRSAYTDEARAGVYTEVFRLAGLDLANGMSVIADAVFGRRSQSGVIADVAEHAGCAFTGVWLELPESERISRIEHRGPDASDATADVARRQTRTLETPDERWHRVDAVGDSVDAVRGVLASR